MTQSPTCPDSESVRRALLALSCLVPLLVQPGRAIAAPFEAGFLRQDPRQPGASALALGALSDEQQLPPGRYRVRLIVNLEDIGEHLLTFENDTRTQTLKACLPPALLGELGLRLDALEDPTATSLQCLDLPGVVPGAQVNFDSEKLQLSLSIPQIALRREVAGYVDPQRWDSGINAAFVNYQASARRSDGYQSSQYSQDLYLNTGLNVQGWRLRSQQSWRQDSGSGAHWDRTNTFAQHDLPGTWGAVTVGESFTDSQVFRSIPMLGIRANADQDMLPDALRSYAPVIRGVAQSRAKLEVWQNGYPIYSTYVSPGPYAIDDLSVGGTGELEVVLTEADGQVRRFQQPYASIGNLLRPGVWNYSAAVGRYNPPDKFDTPVFWQAGLAMGTPWRSSVYGGVMSSTGYRAVALGIARDLGELGALSLDVTHASSELPAPHSDLQGQSYSMRYSKSFGADTHLRFAGYRYSTQGYRDFDEWVRQGSNERSFLGSRRSRLEASVYQRIGKGHSISLNLSQQDYWQHQDVQRQFQFNFSGYHGSLNYSLYASQSLTSAGSHSDRQIGLSLSMPLEFGATHRLSTDVSHSASGSSLRTSLSGQAGQELGYNASVQRDQQRNDTLSLALGYQTPHASLGAGGVLSERYRNVSVNASGAVLLHEDGLAFGPYLGDTMGLVQVPGIADVGIRQGGAARTDANGYALIPHLRPYKPNALVLDTDQLGADVSIENATAQLVPRRGAVVRHRFEARRINRMVLTLHNAEGYVLPFGAQLLDHSGEVVGMVGQGGQLLLALDEGEHTLTARWGEDDQPRCQLQLNPAGLPISDGYRQQTLTCN